MGISIKVTTPEEDRAERQQVLRMSRAQLEKYLIKGDCGQSAQTLAVQRLMLLDIAPAWYRNPNVIIGLLAMLFAAIAAWPIAREWLPQHPHITPSTTVTPSATPAPK